MEFLGKHAIGKVLQDDALKVSSEAKNAKKNDPAVIDGTLGTFYYEDGTFCTHNVVKKVFSSLSDQDDMHILHLMVVKIFKMQHSIIYLEHIVHL